MGAAVCGERTFSARSELHIASLHPVEIISLRALGALPDHAVTVRQLAAQDVTEDLGVAVRVRGEARAGRHAVLIEHPQATEALELRAVVVGEAEGMVCVEPAVVCVPAIARAAGHDLCVAESFRHSLLDDGCGTHIFCDCWSRRRRLADVCDWWLVLRDEDCEVVKKLSKWG